MKQTVEEAARDAIHAHYKCNGEYPCGERDYCEHCNGHNTAFDCCECGADEFKEGFISGAEWQSKQSPWISVNERLPEPNKLVLCRMVSNGAIVSGYIVVSSGRSPYVATDGGFFHYWNKLKFDYNECLGRIASTKPVKKHMRRMKTLEWRIRINRKEFIVNPLGGKTYFPPF